MMIALLLNGEIQAILPKSYIDMLVKEYKFTSRQLYDDACDVEYTLIAGSRNITFDEWYVFDNGNIKKHSFIDIFQK